jgi:hypothetical protein
MNFILNYFIVGYFISLGFALMLYFSSVKEKFTNKDIIGTIIFWPLVTYGFIKELIKQYNGR